MAEVKALDVANDDLGKVVRREDVDPTYVDEFMHLSDNSRKIVSPLLLEDIRRLCSDTPGLEFNDLFDTNGLLTKNGYRQLIAAQPDVVLPQEVFHDVIKAIFYEQLMHYDKTGKNAYHNIPHDFDVTEEGLKVLSELSKAINLPLSEGQIIILAHFAHDLGHSGTTLRQRDTEAGKRDGLSNEKYSIVLADKILKAAGFSIRQRLVFQGLVLSTTFDSRKPKDVPEDEKFPPTTMLERLLAASDLAAGALMKDQVEFIERTVSILCAEKPKSAWPKNMEELIFRMHGFFRYFVASRMSDWSKGKHGDFLGKLSENPSDGLPQLLPVAEKLWGKVFKQRNAMFEGLADSDESVQRIASIVLSEFLNELEKAFQPYFDEIASDEAAANSTDGSKD